MTAPDPFNEIVAGLGFDMAVRGSALGLDAEWFAQHPKQRITMRRLVPGEFGDEIEARLVEGEPYMVIVIRDTVRILVRVLAFEVVDRDDAEVGE